MVIKLNLKIITAAVLLAAIFASVSLCVLSAHPSGDAVKDGSHTVTAVCVPILMYHEVKYKSPGKDVIMPYEFESDLKYLKENGYHTVMMSDLINYVYNNKKLPAKPVVISFDDGYLNNYVYVFPLIKKYNAKIVLSIIGKNTDDFTAIKDENIDYSHVTWGEINEMENSGLVEIQNHTYNLHKITRGRYGCDKKYGESQSDYAAELENDIGKLQTEIRLYTGILPNTFTYPYGKVCKDSLPVLKAMGFKATLSCTYGVNIITKDKNTLYGLRRICRSHNQSAEKSITGAMKTLKYRKIDSNIKFESQ